jgi:low affinity Fe/Cu permease
MRRQGSPLLAHRAGVLLHQRFAKASDRGQRMRRGKWLQVNRTLEKFAFEATLWCGSSWAFLLAGILVLVWLLTGPFFHFTDTWQLVMNTISSIVTFLMVFLLQRSQNKESLAMQVKLDELIAAMKGASNRLISIEELSEQEVRELHERFQKIAERAHQTSDFRTSVSIDQAQR